MRPFWKVTAVAVSAPVLPEIVKWRLRGAAKRVTPELRLDASSERRLLVMVYSADSFSLAPGDVKVMAPSQLLAAAAHAASTALSVEDEAATE